MELCLIRHAPAEERNVGLEDFKRVLTLEGRQKFQRGVRGVKAILDNADFLGTSPFLRCMQTAEILKATYRLPALHSVPEMAPDLPIELVQRWIYLHRHLSKVILVGHEPQLSDLAASLCGVSNLRARLKKGGLVLLESIEMTPQRSEFFLRAWMEPKILRRIQE